MRSIFLICFMVGFGFCDLKVKIIDENFLPYDYSPLKYDNSLMKYKNSSAKYDNSSIKYENSPANYKNSINGKRRIIYNNTYAGYYVSTKSGVTNFFSPSGNRIFYVPNRAIAIFSENSGDFSGILAKGRDRVLLYIFNRIWIKTVIVKPMKFSTF